jgi:hypothetical protein
VVGAPDPNLGLQDGRLQSGDGKACPQVESCHAAN